MHDSKSYRRERERESYSPLGISLKVKVYIRRRGKTRRASRVMFQRGLPRNSYQCCCCCCLRTVLSRCAHTPTLYTPSSFVQLAVLNFANNSRKRHAAAASDIQRTSPFCNYTNSAPHGAIYQYVTRSALHLTHAALY